MKKLSSAALLIMGAILASQTARAQFISDNLYMGFENQAGSGTADYIVNLGAASGIIAGGDLSSDFSLADFDSVLGASSSMFAGVVGGNAGANPTSDMYLTQLRTSNIGDASVAGSTLNLTSTRSVDTQSVNALSTLNVSSSVGGTLDSTLSWENDVEPVNTGSSFLSESGLNPDSAIGTGSVLYEDLWYTTDSQQGTAHAQPFTYLGYFTIDFTGESADVTFSPVPEPGTAMIAGISGLSLVFLRRRFNKNV